MLAVLLKMWKELMQEVMLRRCRFMDESKSFISAKVCFLMASLWIFGTGKGISYLFEMEFGVIGFASSHVHSILLHIYRKLSTFSPPTTLTMSRSDPVATSMNSCLNPSDATSVHHNESNLTFTLPSPDPHF